MATYREKLPYVAVTRRVRIAVVTALVPLLAAIVRVPLDCIVIFAIVIPVISSEARDPEDTDISEIVYLGSLSKNGTESENSVPEEI